jgi:hypothetical protein
LQFAEEGQNGDLGRHSRAEGKRVGGSGGAEDNVFFAAVSAKESSERRQKECVERQFLVLGKGSEGSCLLRGEPAGSLATWRLRREGGAGGRRDGRKKGRGTEALEQLPPIPLRL